MEQPSDTTEDSLIQLHACSENLLISSDITVKKLQNVLFPITPRKSHSADSYLSNTFLKKQTRSEAAIQLDVKNYLKSKDSKELLYKELTPIENVGQPPRWPTECQVLNERIKHIPYKPCPPEPYYIFTGNEVQPKPIGEESGIIVYQYYPISAVNYFCRSSVGGSKYLLPTCPVPEEDTLRFESRFESGNLARAIKITANYYELYLRTDMYTSRHMQWFYFRISNMRKSFLYRFSIVNFTKEESLYTEGMRPLLYSVKDAQIHSVGWRRCGSNIAYFCNDVTPEDSEQIQYYTLSFTLEFPHDDDTVYLAHSYPYTYSDLQDYLLEIADHPIKSSYTTLRLLCKTLAGNNVYYVTITTPPSEENANKKKRAIVITARVHPGETPASWMMHGLLDYLTSDCSPAKELRDNYIFKLVPMLNPDGVIVGNNRCSLTGKDLNRQYRTVIRETYPSIWYTKLMIRRLIEECGVAMYCDLHAHSKKHNIFIFGCENRRIVDRKLYEQVFPLMLHKNAPDKFSFQNCKFKIQKCKEGTGRVVMWMMGISNSFTMEASFGGTTMGNRSETHFNTMDYEQMGRTFCQTLLDFYDEDPKKERLRMKIINRLLKEGSNADEPANIQISDYSSDDGDTTPSSSDLEERQRRKVIRIPAAAPPPSPVKIKKCLIPKLNVPKIHLKSPSRKPLEVCKANVGFSLKNSKSFSSDYTTDSESEKEKKTVKKKKKKKKKKISKKQVAVDISDSEIPVGRDFGILEVMPEGTFKSKLGNRNRYSRYVMESKQSSEDRLNEVQSKLMTLKNKMWFGIGDVDSRMPFWGNTNNKLDSKVLKKTGDKRKPIKKTNGNNKEDGPQKKQKESIKRQQPIELNGVVKTTKLRRVKSLIESSKRDCKVGKFNTYGKLITLKLDPKGVNDVVATSSKSKQKKIKSKTAKPTIKTIIAKKVNE